ncbi:hypothetical protein [Bacillus sp. REN10]|uniref:hypothetical protein n=1 Tax=Bacillus sp. REN10 TaxID=2782541 RepID=UPI00193AF8CC|nr:hypothetical protein [Bacillus sp. REN10]
MDQFATFAYLRPVFFSFIVILSLLLLTVIFHKYTEKAVNGLFVISICAISVFSSALLLYLEGIIVDELNLGGDEVTFYLFISVVSLSVANVVIYFWKHSKKVEF